MSAKPVGTYATKPRREPRTTARYEVWEHDLELAARTAGYEPAALVVHPRTLLARHASYRGPKVTSGCDGPFYFMGIVLVDDPSVPPGVVGTLRTLNGVRLREPPR